MIETPEIVEVIAQPLASLRVVAKWSEMRAMMGSGLRELREAVAAQGVVATGPWFNHHFRAPTDTFDFAICLPVAAPVQPTGRVMPTVLPAGRAARATYHGNYDRLGAAWGELRQWIAAKGLTTREEFWEVYLVGPDSSANPADWRTQLNWPLAAP